MLPARRGTRPASITGRCAAASLWLLVAACRPASSPSTSAPAARSLPPLDDTCTADADCALLHEEIADAPPTTYACCPACTQRAASRAWIAEFRAACQAAPPPMCPPIGCAMPILRAVCESSRCAARPAPRAESTPQIASMPTAADDRMTAHGPSTRAPGIQPTQIPSRSEAKRPISRYAKGNVVAPWAGGQPTA